MTIDTDSSPPKAKAALAPSDRLSFAIKTHEVHLGRADLEQRLLSINAQMAALTPNAFEMPQDAHGLKETPSALQTRLKKNELVMPDTEVLRQLLLEKAQIAEQLQTIPQVSRGLQMPENEFSVKAEKTKMG